MRRYRSAVMFFLLVAVCPAHVRAADRDDAWIRENEIEAVMADMLSSCVVFLKNDTNDKYITGTVFKTSGTVVLTNYHILRGTRDEVYAYFNTASNTVERFRCELLKADPGLDLALFRVTLQGKTTEQLVAGGFVTNGGPQVQMPSTNRYLSPESFADDADIRRGYRIAFLGFPLNYGLTVEKDTHHLLKRPVFRTGTIASENLDGEFLVAAMVSNGNSGSPVFVRAVYKSGNATSLGYKLIGVIKEFQHDTIAATFDGKTAEIPHNTGLGIVIPIGVIKEFIK